MLEEGGLLANLDYLWGDAVMSWGFAAGKGVIGLALPIPESGTSSSFMMGRGVILLIAVSVTTFSLEYSSW